MRQQLDGLARTYAGFAFQAAAVPSRLSVPAALVKYPDIAELLVSWFAAKAYAEWKGKRLPTQDEWEYVARADEKSQDATKDPEFHRRVLAWYGKPTPNPPPEVGSGFRNVYGVHDLHGVVWEWVGDFNTVLVTGESRQDSGIDRGLYCAAGAVGSNDPSDYASYMRYAFRSSLNARYTVGNLGFRCASEPGDRR